MTIPLYIIAPADRVPAALSGAGVPLERFDTVAAFDTPDGREPGVVLLHAATCPAEDVLALVGLLSEAGAPWRLAVIASDGTVRTLGLGLPETADEVAQTLAADRPGLLDLRSVLAEVARVRHDLNNPLTAALAEVQLLLMDSTDPQLREALEVVQAQLRRMRDLIASTKHLRLPGG